MEEGKGSELTRRCWKELKEKTRRERVDSIWEEERRGFFEKRGWERRKGSGEKKGRGEDTIRRVDKKR